MESRNSPEKEEVRANISSERFYLSYVRYFSTRSLKIWNKYSIVQFFFFLLLFFRGHQQRRSHLKHWKMPSVWSFNYIFCLCAGFVFALHIWFVSKSLRYGLDRGKLTFYLGMSPSSGQCWNGGAGEGAEETSGWEVSEGPLWRDSCPLRCQGTSWKKKNSLTDVDCQNFVLFSDVVFVFLFLLGHTTTEQTQSDLWDNNQVINYAFVFNSY